mmetsp:Transcript_7037/g.10347  ORF Transcript_7037/g.10347 Transcript_7037/m.10347 type:complete len:591 (+) Transcript_7037:49-1821(+)
MSVVASFFEHIGALQFSRSVDDLQKKKSTKAIQKWLTNLVKSESNYYDMKFSKSRELARTYGDLCSKIKQLKDASPYEINSMNEIIGSPILVNTKLNISGSVLNTTIMDDSYDDLSSPTKLNNEINTTASPQINRIITSQNAHSKHVLSGKIPTSPSSRGSSFFGKSRKPLLKTHDYRSKKTFNFMIITKQLFEHLEILIQLRIDMIRFYQSLSLLDKYIHYSIRLKTLDNIRSRYILSYKTPLHPFLERLFNNALFELNILYSTFEAMQHISKLKFLEATFVIHNVKNTMNEWLSMHTKFSESSLKVRNKVDKNKLESFSSSGDLDSSSSPSSAVTPISQFDQSGWTSSSTISPSSHTSTTTKKKTLILRTCQLFLWLIQFFNSCKSKYTFIFHDILILQDPHPDRFAKYRDQSNPSYVQSIRKFTKQFNPLFTSLIYNAQDNLNCVAPIDPALGYSAMVSRNRSQLSESGIGMFPSIFVYPDSFDRESLRKQYWPTLVSYIFGITQNENEFQNSILELGPLDLAEAKKGDTFSCFFSLIDERIFYVVAFERAIPRNTKTFSQIAEFIRSINIEIKNRKTFSWITATDS